jgi:hypothetical protein
MSTRKKAKLSPEKERELLVFAAVTREALLQTHATRMLKLIELAANRVSVMRMLDIYTRVHMLSDTDTEVFQTRVLAVLGHRARKGHAPLVYVEGEEERSDKRSFVGVVRDRLRGRQLHDLRRWVELHTGATQAAVLEVHVRYALKFIEELADTHSITEALQIYRDLVAVPANMTDALYIFTLDRLAAAELPRAQTIVAELPRTQEPPEPAPDRMPLLAPHRGHPKRAV